MAHRRIHVRPVALCGAVTGALTVLWGLAYAVAAGAVGGIALVALVLSPVVGIGIALVAARLSGHPAGRAAQDSRPPAVSARDAR